MINHKDGWGVLPHEGNVGYSTLTTVYRQNLTDLQMPTIQASKPMSQNSFLALAP